MSVLCPKCGARRAAADLGDLCPRCLVELSSEPLRPFGDYELLDEIARGGMGVVYRARQRGLDRIVALKLVLSGHFAAPELKERFRTEARAAASLRHPNIVAVHEVGEQDGIPYYSMDFIAGRNLADVAGLHYAGPTWESISGSKVVGKRVQGATVDPAAIPWLLLVATAADGPGVLANTTYIQRVNTVGGLAPATPGAAVGDIARVPYSAEYYFFRMAE